MTFGWEGFSVQHPDDWAPTVLSGGRDQGYVRIASPGRRMLQIRWQRLRRPADADGFLDRYLGRLRRDSVRSRVDFSSSRRAVGTRLEYRYAGLAHGRGILFAAPDGRTFAIEAVSDRADSTSPVLRAAERSFRADGTADRWSAYGLDLTFPDLLTLERRAFLAGKTTMEWRGRGVRIAAERWGLADQLLAKYPLHRWAAARLSADPHRVREEPEGFRISLPPRFLAPPREALVRHEGERNQIVLLQCAWRDPRWRPEWGWLN